MGSLKWDVVKSELEELEAKEKLKYVKVSCKIKSKNVNVTKAKSAGLSGFKNARKIALRYTISYTHTAPFWNSTACMPRVTVSHFAVQETVISQTVSCKFI